jgi:DNA repair photolyase
LAAARIPVGVLVAPVIPGLTDHEIPALLAAAAEAGAKFADHALLRLPQAVAPLFEQWLAQHLPAKKDKILSRIRAMRRGKLNNSQFGLRMSGEGVYAGQIEAMFAVACRKAGLDGNAPQLSAASFRPYSARQLSLFQ